MSYIEPFVHQGDAIGVHKVCFDQIMPNVSSSAWKVLCCIIRKTDGYHKETDAIAYSQIKTGTGIGSNSTVRNALMELQGFVFNETKRSWHRDQKRPAYITAIRHRGSHGEQGISEYTINRKVRIEVDSLITETVISPVTETVKTNTYVPITKGITVNPTLSKSSTLTDGELAEEFSLSSPQWGNPAYIRWHTAQANRYAARGAFGEDVQAATLERGYQP